MAYTAHDLVLFERVKVPYPRLRCKCTTLKTFVPCRKCVGKSHVTNSLKYFLFQCFLPFSVAAKDVTEIRLVTFAAHATSAATRRTCISDVLGSNLSWEMVYLVVCF